MRTLGLTTFQALLLALVTAGVIIALYFLKHRRRRIVISSALLWRRVLEKHLENSLFEKLRRIVSVILAVAIGLLIAMSIARPEIDWLTGEPRQTVIVLDTSPSMLTRTADGRSRWQRAVDQALERIGAGTVSTRFRIVDTSGQVDTPFTNNRAELRRSVERLKPVMGPARFPVIDTPQDKAEAANTSVYFISDGIAPVNLPPNVQAISVFEAASNVGITAFEVRSMPSAVLAYEAYLEIRNAGKEERRVDITVSGAGQQRITRSERIGAGASFREALDLSKFEGGGIRASITSDGDAFLADDVAYAYLPVKRRARTLLVTQGNRFLETVLKLDSLVDLTVISPADYAGTENYDAAVFDRFAPSEPPSRPALVIGAQNVPWLRASSGSVGSPRFESWMEDHPVMQHVSLFDVSVSRAARIDAANLTVLAATRNGIPLIVASDRPRWILLTFELGTSDFAYHAAFPIFVDNALAWFDRERLALRRSPGVVEVPLASAQIRTMDGQTLPSRPHPNGTVFEAAEAGLYVANQSEFSQYIAVNFANHQYSDINNSRLNGEHVVESPAPLIRTELWTAMLTAAVVLISAEWLTYHRRITL